MAGRCRWRRRWGGGRRRIATESSPGYGGGAARGRMARDHAAAAAAAVGFHFVHQGSRSNEDDRKEGRAQVEMEQQGGENPRRQNEGRGGRRRVIQSRLVRLGVRGGDFTGAIDAPHRDHSFPYISYTHYQTFYETGIYIHSSLWCLPIILCMQFFSSLDVSYH